MMEEILPATFIYPAQKWVSKEHADMWMTQSSLKTSGREVPKRSEKRLCLVSEKKIEAAAGNAC